MSNDNQIADLGNEKTAKTTEPVVQAKGGVAEVTPTNTLPDAGSDAKLKDLEVALQKREQDINKLKSTYDKQLAQTKKQFEDEQKKLQEEVRSVKMSGMTDEQKRQFERQLEVEQAGQWREKAQQYERQIQELEIVNNYTQYFQDQGVAKEKLVTNAGVDALVQSGWEGIQEVMTGLKQKVADYEGKLTQGTVLEKKPDETPQTVERSPLTETPPPTQQSWTWEEVEKAYGTLDNYFSKVERQEISPVPLVQSKR